MKHYILYSICLLASLLVACNDDQSSLSPTGILYLNVEEDATILTKAQNGVVSESLQVLILKGEEDTVKVYNDYLTEVKGERLILPIGKYTVAVRSNGADQAGWETPLYAGQEEVEVKQGEITNTKVICKIANTKVSVVYGDDVKEHFLDYQTAVSNTSGSLTFTRDEYRSGFFTPEKLSVALTLINNDGNKFVMQRVYPDIEPQYHYTFRYELSNSGTGDNAGADFEIKVDSTHQEITCKIFIKEESLFGTGKPLASTKGFTDGVYPHKEIDDAPTGKLFLTYKLGTKNRVKNFEVTTTSPNFIAAGLTKFNLLDPAQAGEASNLGFPSLPTDATSAEDDYATYQMDLVNLVSKLKCVDEKPTLHTFTVSLIDDKYQETTTQFAIRVMPNVAAFVDDPYCWSTFALLKGNCSDETCYFKLKIGDAEPIEIAATSGDDGNVSALVTGLKSGVTYSYWLASKLDEEMSCVPISFEMSVPSEVPNLGFEGWNPDTKGMMTGITAGEKTYTSPNIPSSSIYWESGNLGAAAAMNGEKVLTESTEDTAISSSHYAAKLTSKYPGIEGIITKGAFAAGSVYSGYPKEVSDKGAVLMYGRAYQGYPTKLRGYYKYEPKDIDYYDDRCPVKDLKGRKDQGLIYIALIPKQFEVTSKTSGAIVAFGKEASKAFAYGEYVITETKNDTGKEVEGLQNGYVPFEITLAYDEAVPHTDQFYIVIVATSCRYGDYFTGGRYSTLYIDEFELDYNYDPASFSETSLKNMTPININDNK